MQSRNELLALIGITFLGFVAFLDFTIVNTALPIIQKELQMSVIALQWILNVYFLVLASCMVVAGKLADIHGRRQLFYLGGFIFIIGSLIAGCAFTGSMIIFGRLIQGIAAAIIFPVAAALLSEVFKEKSTKALSIYGAIGGMGLAVGPLLGALLTTYLSWRAVFLINVPLAGIGLLLCASSVPKSLPQPDSKIDWLGLIFFMLGIAGIVVGIVNSSRYGWIAPSTLSYFVTGIVSLIILACVERGQLHPLIDMKIITKPLFLIGAIICMMGGVSSGLLLFFLPLYLHTIRGESIIVTGFILFSITLIYTIFSAFINRLVDKLGLMNTIMVGLGALVVAAILLYPLDLSHSVYFALLPCACVGIVWAMGNILSIVAAQQSVDESRVGVATGMVFTSFNIGGSVVLAIATTVFNTMESAHMKIILQREQIQLDAEQLNQVKTMLANPEQAVQALKALGSKSMLIYNAFCESFIVGFHGVATVLLIVSVLSLAAAFGLKKR